MNLRVRELLRGIVGSSLKEKAIDSPSNDHQDQDIIGDIDGCGLPSSPSVNRSDRLIGCEDLEKEQIKNVELQGRKQDAQDCPSEGSVGIFFTGRL
jgi:hypothetical protein